MFQSKNPTGTARTLMVALLAAVVCAPLTVFCPATLLGQQPRKVTEVEGITEYELDNGVQVLLFPDNSKPRFTVNMTVLVGSRHEGYGETGMAHLLEHMLFKGSDQHPDIPKLLKDRGVLNMNGTTWYDRTNYYETLPASDENVEFAIRMEADRLINSWIKAEDLASEMTVVRNEFEMGENSPQRVLFQRVMATAYEWHNYGKSTIGNRADIERVPISNLREFYRKFYQPDNIMVVVAGKFDEKKALRHLNEYFGKLEVPQRELPKTYTQEPVQDGERVVTLRRNGDTQMVGVAYHITAAADPDYAACQVLNQILGMEPSGPLYKSLVETGLASNVSTMNIAGHDPGMMLAMAEVSENGDLEKVRSVLIQEVEKIGSAGIDSESVKRAIKRILKNRERQFANSEQFAINLSEWRAYGDWRLYFLHRDRLEKVTAEDVKRVAADFCVPSNRTVGMFIPTKSAVRAPIASTPNVEKALVGYKGRKKLAEGEAFEPKPEIIQRRTTVGEFAGGIKYAMLPKKTRGERVFLQAQLRFGNDQSLRGYEGAIQLLPQLMTRGTKQLGFQEFRDKLDDLSATMSFGGGTGTLTVNVQTKREHFGDVLDLLRQALREPAFSDDEFQVVQRQIITQIESTKSEPQSVAGTEIGRRLAPYPKEDVRYSPTLDESIQRLKDVTNDKIKDLYGRFLNGQHGEVAIVGDFDPQEAQQKLASIFEGWRSDESYARVEVPAQTVEGSRVSLNTPDKKNAVYIAGMMFPMKDNHPDYEALVIGNYIMGGGPLSSRLADRVRKKEGLSYGVGSQFRADAKDERGMFMMFAISNPENSPKVVSTIDEELTRITESGVTMDELEKAKQSFLKNREGNRAQDRRLVGMLLRNLRNNRTMEFQQQSDDRIADLSKQDVDAALKKYFTKDRLTIITAGDFEKSSESDEDSNEEAGGSSPR